MNELKTLSAVPRHTDATCAAAGCGRPTRTWSRFCSNHARRIYRTGDPNGRILTAKELRPHRELAETFLDRRKDHPAVVAAEEWAAALLNDNVRLPERVLGHMARLREGDTSAREILVAILAVYGVSEQYPNAHVSSRAEFTNLGRAVMRLRPYPQAQTAKGQRYAVPPAGRDAAALGEVVAKEAGAWAMTFWRSINTALRTPEATARNLRIATEKLWDEAAAAEEKYPGPDHWTRRP